MESAGVRRRGIRARSEVTVGNMFVSERCLSQTTELEKAAQK